MLGRILVVSLSLVLVVWLTDGRPADSYLQVFVERKGNNSWIQHYFPPPSIDSQMFSPVFDKDFLKQVLAFKEKLQGLVTVGDRPVSLEDICAKAMGLCVVHSAWSYFQDAEGNIDLEVWDQWRFFILANYLDHLDSCFWEPWLVDDGTALNMSCLPYTGVITPATAAFALPECGSFPNSTSLIISFAVRDNRMSNQTVEWWKTVLSYVTSGAMASSFPNMTVTLVPDPLKI